MQCKEICNVIVGSIIIFNIILIWVIMKEIPLDIDTLIVGAGPSGLACAIQCQKNNRQFFLIEQSERVGGRVGSIKEDGFIFDIGFQVYNTAYEVTNSLLDFDTIVLNHFKPGAMIHDGVSFQIVSDPLRDISQLFSTLFSNISTLGDKFKILKLKSSLRGYEIDYDRSIDVTTHNFLLNQGFSERIIEMFFRPFFSGIFLENKLETSSKFFKYVFSSFNSGLASLPENGMQAIPNNLLKNIDREKVLFNKRVVKIGEKREVIFEDGSFVNAKNLVLTGDSSSLVTQSVHKYNEATTLYLSSKIKPVKAEYIHLYPRDHLINNIAVPTSISKSYSESEEHLISVTVIDNNLSELSLIDNVQSRLMHYYGGGKDDYRFLKCFQIKKGTLKQLPGHFDNVLEKNTGMIISGEHQKNGSIEGAVLSGVEAENFL